MLADGSGEEQRHGREPNADTGGHSGEDRVETLERSGAVEIARAVGIGGNQGGGEGDDREDRDPAAMVGRADGKEPDVLLVAEDVHRQEGDRKSVEEGKYIDI